MKLFLVAAFSFLAVIDLQDPAALKLVEKYQCDHICNYTTGAQGAGIYGVYHCPDEAFGNLKTRGTWVEDPTKP